MPAMFIPPQPQVPFELPYTGSRLRWAIAVMGWSNNHFAARLGMDQGSLRQMLNGSRFIPDVLAIWIETQAQFYLAFPRPMGWNDKSQGIDNRFGYQPREISPPVDAIVVDNETV
jgi:transcriptional regulator with XRE-family HTH domain